MKLILLNKLFILIPNLNINLFNLDKYLNIINWIPFYVIKLFI